MISRGLLISTLVLVLALAINLLTRDKRLIGVANSHVSSASDFTFDAAEATWSLWSPLELSFAEARLTHASEPARSLKLDSVRVRYAWRPRPILAHIAFNSRQVSAHAILAYLGASFAMTADLEVRGEVSFDDSASGALHIRSGPGTLDTRGLDRMNRGPVRWARDSGHFVDWPEVMAFDLLQAEFDARGGFEDSTFALAFENLRLEGRGAIDIVSQEIDYRFDLRIGSQSDQAGFRTGDLVADVPWPIRCQGSFATRLPCRLDFDALRDLALRLIERDADDAFSRTFGEVEQALFDD